MAVRVAATLLAVLALITGAGWFSDAVTTTVLELHAAAMVPLVFTLVLACSAAFMPGGRRLRFATVALMASSAVLLVGARVESHASTSPGWICTASHVGVAVIPAIVVLLGLRRCAHTLLRALTAGLAVGATGAFVGELVCEQGPLHVALFHLPAWAITTALVAFVSSRLKPVSFAP
jgi:hypothetical protein